MAWFSGSNLASLIWRAFVTDGVPASGAHEPVKPEIRTWGTLVQTRLETVLDADRSYFVSTTGNDTTGDGSSGNPWLTRQKAWDEVAKLDLNGFTIRVRTSGSGAGRGETAATVVAMSKWPKGSGTVRFEGDTATPSNVILTSTGANGSCVQLNGSMGGCIVELEGFKFVASGSGGAGIDHTANGRLILDTCHWGNCDSFFIKLNADNSHIEGPSSQTWTFDGDTGTGILVDSGYLITVGTIALANTPLFTGSIVEVNFRGVAFTTAWTGTPDAASLTACIVKDGATLRVHTNSPIPGSGARNIAPGALYDDGGFAVQNSCYPVAHALVTFSGGVPSLNSDSYGFNNVIDTATGRTTMTLNSRMKNSTYCVIAVVQDTADASTKIVYTSDQVFIVETYSAAVALADLNYSVAVFGSQRADF